jgi:predicted nucleic acid-binding Zn ribbon protein
MPVYDYVCNNKNCKSFGKRADNVFVHRHVDTIKCKGCNKTMTRLFPNSVSLDIIPSEGIFIRDASPQGVVFHSKSEMRDYQKKHNVQLSALL